MLDKISGELRIFTREYEAKDGTKRVMFNTCVGFAKNADDEYINAYVPVTFAKDLRKDVPYTEKYFDTLVKEAFFTAYKDSDDIARLKLFINRAKFITANNDEVVEDKKKSTTKKAKAKDDLPF